MKHSPFYLGPTLPLLESGQIELPSETDRSDPRYLYEKPYGMSLDQSEATSAV